jgi:hypothetical protein
MNATLTERTNTSTTNSPVATICNSHDESQAAVGERHSPKQVYIMKHRPTFLLLALFAGLSMAQTSRADSWFTAITTGISKIYWFSSPTTTESWNNLEPVESLSPRAWTTTVGLDPCASGFADAESCSPRMCLFWVGNEPWLNTTSLIHD